MKQHSAGKITHIENEARSLVRRALALAILFLTTGLIEAQVATPTSGSFNYVTANGSAWVHVGTLALPQQGNNAFLRFHAGSGYNGVNSQNGYVDLLIRTSNAVNTIPLTFCASAYASRHGEGGASFMQSIKLVSDTAGCTPTKFDVYALIGTYSGNGFYTVESSPGVTWTQTMALGDSTATGASMYVVPFEEYLDNPVTITGSPASLNLSNGTGFGSIYEDGNLHVESGNGAPVWLN